ncbi:hypothetical protein NQ095_06370 [Rossellomorea sp. SC111]|uniref:hypothetical protein n=1 Tax=Rossellomorea sp. SC111 TaxID=2968985 RepID=UPI00215B18AE|nr:hypothetical protein [Rossellomorea sp. SC111]MCR8848027.1 hypothetical protein [Rossellomorea sp. SC111]
MDGIFLIIIVAAIGCAIVGTVFLANKALGHYMHNRKGIDQQSATVICPHCGAKNKRQVNGQHCKECYEAF